MILYFICKVESRDDLRRRIAGLYRVCMAGGSGGYDHHVYFKSVFGHLIIYLFNAITVV